ncbi:hypothetical protein AMR41_08775 [Hapalosiphon sp. MRB220]|nr:hypothetical protein AMR41_08775 [Hapalosiphon sp. MRB220]
MPYVPHMTVAFDIKKVAANKIDQVITHLYLKKLAKHLICLLMNNNSHQFLKERFGKLFRLS